MVESIILHLLLWIGRWLVVIGKILGNRYEILEKIGAGGMGDVYKAHCRKLDRIVAVKVLKSQYNEDNNFIRKFKRESLAAASISHPNIVGIYDVGSEEVDSEKVHYIVMEYIDGKTLKEHISEVGRIPEKKALNYAVQIAEALKTAHSKNIVHRDIKSQNIMLTRDDRIKVTDFGIARIADNTTVTATNAIMGSVHYFSPEQAKGTTVDNRSDIYSLGIVLYEMLTGVLPFDADNPVSVALMQVQSNMPLPSTKFADISSDADKIVLKMTMKEPNDRYKDVNALISDIRGFQMGRSISSPSYTQTSVGTAPIGRVNQAYANPEKKVIRRNEEPIIKEPQPVKKKKKSSALPVLLGILTAILLVFFIYLGFKMISNKENTQTQAQITMVKVPEVVGMTEEQAKAKIEAAGLKMNISNQVEDDNKKDREIISQSPSKDTEAAQGSVVDVVINIVSDSVTVPNLSGLTVEQAQQSVSEAGLKITDIKFEESSSIEAEKVARQEPTAGSKISKSQGITIYISKGAESKPEVPSVTGVKEINAIETLKKLGYEVKTEYISAKNVDDGEVSKYEPTGKLEKGETVTIYVRDASLDPVDDEKQKEKSNYPSSLTVTVPEDGKRHKVNVTRTTAKGAEYEIYSYTKDSSANPINVNLEYVEKGDRFLVKVDDKVVDKITID